MECQECGMTTEGHEYHPYAACLMFKACGRSDVVRENLHAVVNHGVTHTLLRQNPGNKKAPEGAEDTK